MTLVAFAGADVSAVAPSVGRDAWLGGAMVTGIDSGAVPLCGDHFNGRHQLNE